MGPHVHPASIYPVFLQRAMDIGLYVKCHNKCKKLKKNVYGLKKFQHFQNENLNILSRRLDRGSWSGAGAISGLEMTCSK